VGRGGLFVDYRRIALNRNILFLKANSDIVHKHVLLQINSKYPESEIAATTIFKNKQNAEKCVKFSLKFYT
jgi:hypothetical protein